jgi:hypothetical protein
MAPESKDIRDLMSLYEAEKMILAEDEVVKADKYTKMQLIQKVMELSKFSEQFLKKMDENALRTIYKAFMGMGIARVQKDLSGTTEEA